MARRLLICGAAGSGTTTLGNALVSALGCPHYDADDFYWLPVDPPYQTKRQPQERNQILNAALRKSAHWVLSGSIENWDLTDFNCDLIVFLTASTEVRLERLRIREAERFGSRIQPPEGDLYQRHLRFLEWASQYDEGYLPGRSRRRQEGWLRCITTPVLRLDSGQTVQTLVRRVIDCVALRPENF